EDVFIRFMENDVMDALPLIDVKAVKPNYRFIRNGDESFQYYACARDGWLAVNNPVDGSYLWIDSRRPGDFPSEPDYPLPYFEHGSFTDTTPWPVACGFGGSDEWFPTPPGNGNPDDCSAPELCTPDSGGGGEQDAGVGGSDAGQPPPPDAGGSPDAGVSPDAGGVPADLVVRRTCLPANPGAGTPASVRVDVINQGLGSAGASTTRTLFADGSSDNHPTPVLAGAGAMHSYTLALPPLCFGCGFTVDADFFNVVGETNEGNNGIASSCSP
ncbi:MAG: CARDB domain-containing protein, partial [Myxococcota bacterium]